MQPEWWEDPVCWVCNWWKIILTAIALLTLLLFFFYKSPPVNDGLTITLAWSSPNDLDISVVEPSGVVLNHVTPISSSGGNFIQDTNRNCSANLLSTPNEKIVWADKMPEGSYQILVTLHRVCGNTPETFMIEIANEHEKLKSFSGLLEPYATKEFCLNSPSLEECNE